MLCYGAFPKEQLLELCREALCFITQERNKSDDDDLVTVYRALTTPSFRLRIWRWLQPEYRRAKTTKERIGAIEYLSRELLVSRKTGVLLRWAPELCSVIHYPSSLYELEERELKALISFTENVHGPSLFLNTDEWKFLFVKLIPRLQS